MRLEQRLRRLKAFAADANGATVRKLQKRTQLHERAPMRRLTKYSYCLESPTLDSWQIRQCPTQKPEHRNTYSVNQSLLVIAY